MKNKLRLLKSWQLAVIDIVILGIALNVFALFNHVLSGKTFTPIAVSAPAPVATPAPTPVSGQEEIIPQETTAPVETAAAEPELEPVAEFAQFDFPGMFTNGEVTKAKRTYKSANVAVNIEHHTSSGKYKQSFYVADIYVRSAEYLKCVFANDTVGQNELEKFESMSKRSNSIVSINTDFYGFSRRAYGLVIRNGALYRDALNPKDDMCIIFKDGTMQMYKAGTQLDCAALMNEGAWQGFSFGPILVVDGKPVGNFADVSREARVALGYVEPGHYKFIVADGGQDDAKGFTYSGIADIAADAGCVLAYNLDGGQSAQMGFMGSYANTPEKGGRRVSDILIVSELEGN